MKLHGITSQLYLCVKLCNNDWHDLCYCTHCAIYSIIQRFTVMRVGMIYAYAHNCTLLHWQPSCISKSHANTLLHIIALFMYILCSYGRLVEIVCSLYMNYTILHIIIYHTPIHACTEGTIIAQNCTVIQYKSVKNI